MPSHKLQPKEAFNLVPELYDEIRPGYPKEVLQALEQYAELNSHSRIVEVGPGTGQASQYFIEQGYQFTGVEPGADLLLFAAKKFAQRKNASFVQEGFEAWDCPSRSIELVFGAQSFHWIEPDIGIKKAWEILTTSGSLGLMWNLDESQDTEFWRKSSSLHEYYFPEGSGNQGTNLKEWVRLYTTALQDSPFFQNVEVRDHTWSRVYTADDWIKMRNTFSPDLMLSSDQRQAFHKALRLIIDELGGSFTRYYRTVLIVAKRR